LSCLVESSIIKHGDSLSEKFSSEPNWDDAHYLTATTSKYDKNEKFYINLKCKLNQVEILPDLLE